MAQINDSDYRKAQQSRDPEVIQDFFDSLDLGKAKPAVTKITYLPWDLPSVTDSNGYDSESYTLMQCRHPPFPNSLKDANLPKMRRYGFLSSEILVFPRALRHRSDFFASILFDHEIYHARQFFERPKAKMNLSQLIWTVGDGEFGDEISSATEIPAYVFQLSNKKNRKLREYEVQNLQASIRREVDLFSKVEKITGIDLRQPLKDLTLDIPFEEVNDWLGYS